MASKHSKVWKRQVSKRQVGARDKFSVIYPYPDAHQWRADSEMNDIADNADKQIEQELARNLAVRKPQLVACGACWNCESILPDGLLFCNSSCHEDWERIEAAKLRNGNA